MITEKENKRISKFLSFVLRHQPGLIGIELDENGWTGADLLIERSAQAGVGFDKEILSYIVETNSKQRFAFDETHTRIRANQGHSVEIGLGYVPQQPPEILYHGAGVKSVDLILQTGLDKRDRHHVHLSKDFERAINVGKRHGKPFVFEVLAGQMFADKWAFFVSANGVWLTEHVPVKYLKKQ